MDRLKTSPSSVDDELITAVRSGGPAGDHAVMRLYKLYHKDIASCMRHFILGHGKWYGDAEDITHDSFIVMIDKIRSGTPYLITARAFWLGIAKYIWLNQQKKNKLSYVVNDNDAFYGLSEITPESAILYKERFRQIEIYLSHLNPKYRALMLMWLSDYSMQEIADHLHLSGPNVARKIKFICCRKLRTMLNEKNILK